jgi:hypothetical protein
VCFSATGSFAMSGVLMGLGIASGANAPTKAHRAFAAIPFLFGAQQASEGIVWLTLGDPRHATLHRVAVDAFLAFALVIWPTWLSTSLAVIERRATRRRGLTALAAWGAFVSVYAAVLLATRSPFAEVAGHSIRYEWGPSPFFYLIVYLIPTVVPFFVSTASFARTLGVLLVLSLGATVLARRETLTSVWCFCGALLSAIILAAVLREAEMTSQVRGQERVVQRPNQA